MAKTEVDFNIRSPLLWQTKRRHLGAPCLPNVTLPFIGPSWSWEVGAQPGTAFSSPSYTYMGSYNYLSVNASPCDTWSLSFFG